MKNERTQKKVAESALRKSSRRFKRRRITVLMRVSRELLSTFKKRAQEEKCTMSKLADKAIKAYLARPP